jgi:F420-non-reducing hydrogenase iron-sulfur subunit
MCSGRVHPKFVLEAFARGADGVLVTGCHIGDCHYIDGNHYTRARMEKMGDLLESIGIDKRRFQLEWVSAAEGNKFAALINKFTKQIRELGPNKLKIKFPS